MELKTRLAKKRFQHVRGTLSQLSDSGDAVLPQHALRGFSHKEEVAHRQGKDNFLPVVPADDRGGIRLFIVAAQLGKYLVKRDPH